MTPLPGDSQGAAGLAVSSLGVLAAALPLLAQLVALRRSSLRRDVTLTLLRWPPRPGEKRVTGAPLARLFRWVAVGVAVFSAAYVAYEIRIASRTPAGQALQWFAVMVGVGAIVNCLLLIVFIDVGRAGREALSRSHRIVEMSVGGAPLDATAELLRFLRRHRFEPMFYEFEAGSGIMACQCMRWWYGPMFLPQYLAIVGSADDTGLHLTILADLRPMTRVDLGRNEKNLERLVRHFSLPPASRT